MEKGELMRRENKGEKKGSSAMGERKLAGRGNREGRRGAWQLERGN